MSLPAGPLTRLTSAVREGRLLATTLVERSIERLQKHDPLLNVLAERAFDEALERAALVDRGVTRAGALVGVPALVKDLEEWQGHPTRKGSLAPAQASGARASDPLRVGWPCHSSRSLTRAGTPTSAPARVTPRSTRAARSSASSKARSARTLSRGSCFWSRSIERSTSVVARSRPSRTALVSRVSGPAGSDIAKT